MGPVDLVRPNVGRRVPLPITARPSQAMPGYRHPHPHPPPESANGGCMVTAYRPPFVNELAGLVLKRLRTGIAVQCMEIDFK